MHLDSGSLSSDATPECGRQTSATLARPEWLARQRAYVARVSEWADARVARATRDVSDPVYDFLFEYYPFRPSHLKRWSPGVGVVLQDAELSELDWADDFQVEADGAYIPALSFPERRRDFLEWAHKYLTGIAARPPQFSCFGLHEWAMVYRCEKPRHTQVPMRLSRQEIDKVVESSDLRCTHYDAFRFFTPGAVPLNKNRLTRELTTDFDQRACIHVTMDLYRFAHKIAPWATSELIGDAFLLAADARRIDMRASPYDLQAQGFEPIRVETATGREEYINEQRRLAELAVPIRQRLIDVYGELIGAYKRYEGPQRLER
jgi:hypothetical protein